MAKYLPGKRPFEGLIFVDPQKLARQVFERFQTVVRTHIDEMATRYNTYLRETAMNRAKINDMIANLAEHYRKLENVAKAEKEEMGLAKEAYSVEKGRALAEIYR